MAATYTRFLGAAAPATGAAWTELLRAPSTGTVVVRDVLVSNIGTTAVAEAAIRDRPLTRAGDVWWWYAKAVASGTVHLELRQVLRPGHALELYVTDGTVHCAVTGYVFAT